jgi:hypothetical protein
MRANRLLPLLCLAAVAGSFADAPGATAREAVDNPVSRRKAAGVLDRARDAAGGAANLQRVKDIVRTVEMTHASSGLKARQTLKAIFPGTLRIFNSTGPVGGGMSAFFDKGQGWISSAVSLDRQLPAWQVRAAQQDLMRQLEWLLMSGALSDRRITFVETREVQGRSSSGIEIHDSEAGSVRLWIEVSTGDPVALQYRRVGPQGEREQVVDYYSDYQWQNGIRTPRRIMTRADGQPYMETVVLTVAYNSRLRTDELAKVSE